MKKLFDGIWILLGKMEGWIMIASTILLVTLVIVQVALRYIFKLPLMGVEELACMAGFWMYMIGAASGSRERSHIRADLLQAFIKNEKTYQAVMSVVTFLTFVLACIMTSWCWNYVKWSVKSWERSPALMIPMIYAQASLLFSSALMAFYFLIELIDHVRRAAGHPALHLPQVPWSGE